MNALAPALRAMASGLAAWLVMQGLLFALVQAAPGGPAAALAGDFATRETQAAVSRSFGLDQPKPQQFAAFVGHMALGDFGSSYHFRRPVAELISDRIGPTLLLMLASLAIALAAGGALGLWAAGRGRGGTALAAVAAVAYALPVFWVGQLLMLTGGLELGWFPVSGASDPRLEGAGPLATALDLAWHAVLPVATLAIQQAAFFATVVHAKARLELDQGYVRAARARGIAERAIRWGHVGRNVAPQLAVVALNRFGMLFTGTVLVETLFAWPGLGRLLASALLNRDHPVLLGCFGLIAATVIASSVVADVLQARLDPRVGPVGGPAG
ncbi:MAG: ABC transporter permease [Burkholderiaceae bacterium]